MHGLKIFFLVENFWSVLIKTQISFYINMINGASI